MQARTAPPGADVDDLPAWQGLAELLLTAAGGVRRRWDARQGFPAPGEKGIGADERARRNRHKAAVQALSEALVDDPTLRPQWQALRHLPVP